MDIPIKDPLEKCLEGTEELVRRTRKSLRENPMPCGSRALAFAMAAGLPPKMSYTVMETARYTGIDYQQLRKERDAGRLAFTMSHGNAKGARIKVEEIDRWMDEN